MTKIDYRAFESKRLDLIYSLEAGRIDKSEFLSKSYDMFKGALYLEPDLISTVEQGVFYYFYFNTMAKNHMKRSKSDSTSQSANISNEYYKIKEQVLLALLSLFKDEEISAYYVKTDSVKLKNNLVEIYINNREKLIFHTINPKTIRLLKGRNLLNDNIQESCITSYINKKYY